MNALQEVILEILLFVDKICRENDIRYYIMGGTALGAVRHGGFIPWDDDIDIFMTPTEYEKFKTAFRKTETDLFVIQEWKIVDEYIESVKVRKNGTAFIEKNLKDRKDLHQGIFLDIMILHKIPSNRKLLLGKLYYYQKYLALKGNANREWQPKTSIKKVLFWLSKRIPRWIDRKLYKAIYRYKDLESGYDYMYYITKANFRQGHFKKQVFEDPVLITFEGHKVMAPANIREYLEIRYGNYMEPPPEDRRLSAIHAIYWSVDKDYKEVLKELGRSE